MDDNLSVIVTIGSYSVGAWAAFKIYDLKMKDKTFTNDSLLFFLLLVFGVGGGGLLDHLLKTFMSGE